MNLVAHLVRADVRRFRLLIAGWVLIEVMSTIFTAVQPVLGADPRMMTTVALLGSVLFLTRWLGMIVLVALVVQTHPLVGSDAFWMTRPIPPRGLLASKVVLLVTTFVAVPALCQVVLMSVFRVPVAEMALVALQTVLFQSLWLAVVMALAAMTRNLARFVLVAGAVVVSFMLFTSIAIAMAFRHMPDGPQLSQVMVRSLPQPSTTVVVLLLLISAALIPVVIQYFSRNTRASVGAGAAGLAAVYVVLSTWSPGGGRPLPAPPWATTEPAVHLVAASPKGAFRPDGWSPWKHGEDWQMGSAQLKVRAIEPSWVATIRLADSTVQFDDGVTLRTAGNGHQASVPFEGIDEFPNRVVTGQVLGVGGVAGMTHGSWITGGVPAIVMSQADFKKYSAASGTYRGRFLLDLDRVEIAATLPLQAGAEYRDRRRIITIDQVIPKEQTPSIRLRQLTVSTVFHSESLPELSFYLRNRDAAAAVAGSRSGPMHMSTGLSLPLAFGFSGEGPGAGGFDVRGEYVQFSGHTAQEETIEITADWLSRAELVILRTVQWGSVTRTVEIPGFEIRAAPPPPTMLRVR